jgi:hypothetical protein
MEIVEFGWIVYVVRVHIENAVHGEEFVSFRLGDILVLPMPVDVRRVVAVESAVLDASCTWDELKAQTVQEEC